MTNEVTMTSMEIEYVTNMHEKINSIINKELFDISNMEEGSKTRFLSMILFVLTEIYSHYFASLLKNSTMSENELEETAEERSKVIRDDIINKYKEMNLEESNEK